jgi:enterobactin synthetase component D
VGRRDDGTPVWPSLVCGSISHSTEIVIAVASLRRDHLSLGVDCEPLMPFDVRTDLLDQISVPRERRLTEAAGLDADLGASLIFSGKESLYKCLWPLAGIFLDFSDACLTEIDRQRGTFQLQLTRRLASSWEVGRTFAGRFNCLGDHVVTLIGLPSQSRLPRADGSTV